jgi:cytochrome c
VGFCALIVICLCGGLPPVRAQDFSNLESRGFAIVSKQCASCHAIARSDISPYPKAPPFRILNRRYPDRPLSEAFAGGIIVGHVDMPEFKFLPEEVEAVVAYLKYVQVPGRR